MKRTLLALGIVGALAIGQSASATTYTFGDTANSWPGWGTAAENSTDVIGSPNITGGTVDVTTNGYVTKLNIDALGLLWHDEFISGDLFINIVRDSNDTSWDYIVKSLGAEAGSVAIYDVRSANMTVADAGAYSYVMSQWPTPADVRDNQPIGVLFDTSAPNPIATGATFSGLTNSGVTYDFGNGLSLEGHGNVLFAWTVNCGNDVLYEQVPVPEPGTFALLGAGLLGLGLYARRKKQL